MNSGTCTATALSDVVLKNPHSVYPRQPFLSACGRGESDDWSEEGGEVDDLLREGKKSGKGCSAEPMIKPL
jgi:hypothetical protein